ncbi:MAG: zinc ABC transporter substrate-binding protein [Betaproteobacteria bacterium]|jgi:zinc/manganese transport system substrate-binding protein|nr:zinc ABC transporter substrate-binding protein [Betaproteobacteria bacterium]
MKTPLCILAALTLAVAAAPVHATLNVLACEPEWGALVSEIAGDKAKVYVATTAQQDPHHVQARPALIARARSADLLVCTGAELEVGWLPLLLSKGANPSIQVGQPGYFEAARQVTLLELPRALDRSLGDVHAAGNPHIQLDPRNIAKVADALAERMAQIAPADAETFRARNRDFQSRWQTAIKRWEAQAAPLQEMPIVVYHKNVSYLENWLGLKEIGTLEPLPGIPPTPSHLAELIAKLRADPARAIIYAAYQSPQAAEFVSAQSKVPAVMIPFTVGGSDRAKDLFGLFDDTISRLLDAQK